MHKNLGCRKGKVPKKGMEYGIKKCIVNLADAIFYSTICETFYMHSNNYKHSACQGLN